MSDIEINSTGIPELTARLREAGQPERIFAAIKAGALHLVNSLREYPQQPHRPQPFVSDKQRRGFFARLRRGEIEVPYRRGQSPGSESLKHRWTSEAILGGYGQQIGNNASYARLVQDRDKQTKYHQQTGWPTYQDVQEREGDNVIKLVEREIVVALMKVFGKI